MGDDSGVGPQHVVTWDATYPTMWAWEHWPEVCRWARAHGGTDWTWRYEVWMMDTPYARVYAYALNDQGHVYVGAGGDVAQEPVLLVALDALPPEALCDPPHWGRAQALRALGLDPRGHPLQGGPI